MTVNLEKQLPCLESVSSHELATYNISWLINSQNLKSLFVTCNTGQTVGPIPFTHFYHIHCGITASEGIFTSGAIYPKNALSWNSTQYSINIKAYMTFTGDIYFLYWHKSHLIKELAKKNWFYCWFLVNSALNCIVGERFLLCLIQPSVLS